MGLIYKLVGFDRDTEYLALSFDIPGKHAVGRSDLEHHLRCVNAGDVSRRNRLREILNNDARTETHLPQFDNPRAAIRIHARHYQTAQSAQSTLRTAKHPH